jgi:hypothetical protein
MLRFLGLDPVDGVATQSGKRAKLSVGRFFVEKSFPLKP